MCHGRRQGCDGIAGRVDNRHRHPSGRIEFQVDMNVALDVAGRAQPQQGIQAAVVDRVGRLRVPRNSGPHLGDALDAVGHARQRITVECGVLRLAQQHLGLQQVIDQLLHLRRPGARDRRRRPVARYRGASLCPRRCGRPAGRASVALIEARVSVSSTPRMTVTTSRSARSVNAGLGYSRACGMARVCSSRRRVTAAGGPDVAQVGTAERRCAVTDRQHRHPREHAERRASGARAAARTSTAPCAHACGSSPARRRTPTVCRPGPPAPGWRAAPPHG